MHERSLVRQLLKQIERLMEEHGSHRVTLVRLSIGEFSGVEPELVKIAFEDMVNHTRVHGAKVQMARVPLEARCENCRYVFFVEHFRFECPRCAGRQLEVLRGEELVLESVVMENPSHEQRAAFGNSA